MTNTKKRRPRATKNEVLPANAEVRELADLVKSAGNYGSYVNTLRVALKNQYRNLTGADAVTQNSSP